VALRSLSVVFCLLNICYFLSLMLTTSSLAQKNLPLKGAGVGVRSLPIQTITPEVSCCP
jgi:hypothetical protein